jgi:hypothetical protein
MGNACTLSILSAGLNTYTLLITRFTARRSGPCALCIAASGSHSGALCIASSRSHAGALYRCQQELPLCLIHRYRQWKLLHHAQLAGPGGGGHNYCNSFILMMSNLLEKDSKN